MECSILPLIHQHIWLKNWMTVQWLHVLEVTSPGGFIPGTQESVIKLQNLQTDLPFPSPSPLHVHFSLNSLVGNDSSPFQKLRIEYSYFKQDLKLVFKVGCPLDNHLFRCRCSRWKSMASLSLWLKLLKLLVSLTFQGFWVCSSFLVYADQNFWVSLSVPFWISQQ